MEDDNDLEKIKRDGIIQALKKRLFSLRDRFATVPNTATRLGCFEYMEESIGDAEFLLKQMRETLAELQKYEPENK